MEYTRVMALFIIFTPVDLFAARHHILSPFLSSVSSSPLLSPFSFFLPLHPPLYLHLNIQYPPLQPPAPDATAGASQGRLQIACGSSELDRATQMSHSHPKTPP